MYIKLSVQLDLVVIPSLEGEVPRGTPDGEKTDRLQELSDAQDLLNLPRLVTSANIHFEL